MITTSPVHDLDYDLARLARIVRAAPAIHDALAWWTGYPLAAQQATEPATEALTEADAPLLDLPAGTPVLRRTTRLISAASSPILIAATVVELVAEPAMRFNLAARRALREGDQLVETLLDGLHRAAYLVTRPETRHFDDEHTAPVLIGRAVLSAAGRPVALTTETVRRQLLTRRAPDVLPHYAARLPTPNQAAR
ncbi:hypothetical protein ACFORH_39140 [Amycolatopsis roodepoortensis]|uniref:Uncharacterized protein n=1 Tax=Amycolatopsis roodepoortensis TaxID=700274 RepID=A0ABR9LJ08_9PSEU|nr:hypothetical protein [Amycolatopsis roodepoortensis]MBE1580532.1 hypothetical protein [Amycolatopsis roodepoortensis]